MICFSGPSSLTEMDVSLSDSASCVMIEAKIADAGNSYKGSDSGTALICNVTR